MKWDFMDYLFVGIMTCMGIFLIVAVVSMFDCQKRANRLMADCLADGHKEYECESMLSRPRSYYPH